MVTLYKKDIFGKIITDYNIVPDLAGRWNELSKIVKALPGNYFSLGDLTSRGIDSKKVLDFFMNNPNNKAILGNHEHVFIDFYRHNKFYLDMQWLSHGGEKTVLSFIEEKKDKEYFIQAVNYYLSLLKMAQLASHYQERIKLYKEADDYFEFIRKLVIEAVPIKYIEWMEKLPLYYENTSMILTHGSINPNLSFEKCLDLGTSAEDAHSIDSIIWNRSKMSSRDDNKIQIHGHTALFEPLIFKNDKNEIIGLDLDVSKGQKLFVYVGKEDALYYEEYELLDFDHKLIIHFNK